MSQLAEVEAALAGATPVDRSDYLRWAGSDDLAVQARAYALSATAWARISPEPTQDEQCEFMARYLLHCLVKNPTDDDVVHAGFQAGHELAAWLKHLVVIPGADRHIISVSNALASTIRNENAATRNRIETAVLEHVLEEPRLRPYFASWASDPQLAETYEHALSWGRAHEANAAAADGGWCQATE